MASTDFPIFYFIAPIQARLRKNASAIRLPREQRSRLPKKQADEALVAQLRSKSAQLLQRC
jgi:hypothetical protein